MIGQETPDIEFEKVETEPRLEELNSDNSKENETENSVEEQLEAIAEIEKQNEEQIRSLVGSILEEDTDFEKAVESSSIRELVLLMEVIAVDDENIRQNVSRVGILKKSFDKKYHEEIEKIKTNLSLNEAAAKKNKSIFEAYSYRFTLAIAKYNKKRDTVDIQIKEEKTKNTELKKQLIQALKQIVEEGRFEAIQEVRDIHNQWHSIGQILPEEVENINNSYKLFREQFFKFRENFKELIEQDYELHLQEKLAIIEEIKNLTPSDEELSSKTGDFWREASERMIILQERYRVIGPIASDKREKIKSQYTEAVDKFYAQRQKYYEHRDAQRIINGKVKQEFIEQIKPFASFNSTVPKEWKQKAEELKEYQEKWKKIGPAISEVETELWLAFRAICNAFFNNKSAFFKTIETKIEEINKQRVELCEKLESLIDEPNLKKVMQTIKQIRIEWENLQKASAVYADSKLRKRYHKAISRVQDRLDEYFNEQNKIFQENLDLKNSILDKLKEIEQSESVSAHYDEIKELEKQWKEITNIPYTEKEKLYEEFKAVCDKIYNKLRSERKSYDRKEKKHSFDSNEKNKKPTNNISKLKYEIERIQEEIETLSSNIGFFKDKSTEKLKLQYQQKLDDAQKRLQELKLELKKILDAKNDAQKSEEKNTDKQDSDEKKS